MLNPPIKRMGGKSRLRKKIISMIPEHTCYAEVFFGAGWVYFGKEPSKVEVINDIDKELINLFKIIKYHAPEVERLLEYEYSARNIFDEYKNATIEYMTDIYRAVRFLYLINTSFASKGGTYGYATTSRPAPQLYLRDKIYQIRDRLSNTFVENLTFEKIVKKYDRNHTFFFVDPPYFETDGYEFDFNEEHHIILRDLLSGIDGKFLLTINDHQKVREWYKDFKIEEVAVNYSISREAHARKTYEELIITNY